MFTRVFSDNEYTGITPQDVENPTVGGASTSQDRHWELNENRESVIISMNQGVQFYFSLVCAKCIHLRIQCQQYVFVSVFDSKKCTALTCVEDYSCGWLALATGE